MRNRLNIFVVFTLTTCCTFVCTATEPADPNRYLNAVRTFADNVLKYDRDTYGPQHTPLFVDGLNTHTHEPVKWKYKRACMNAPRFGQPANPFHAPAGVI